MGDYFDLLPNYTGPYISNGLFQESVEFGDREPKDMLDALSRLHDSAYAKWDDRLHRTVADLIYNQDAKKLVGKFPELARYLVTYGNQTARSAETLVERMSQYGPFGLLVGGVENMYELNKLLNNRDSTEREIRDYYRTDPYIQFQLGGRKTNDTKMNAGTVFGTDEDFIAEKNKSNKGTVYGSDSDFLAEKRKLDRAKLKARTYDPKPNPAEGKNAYGDLPANESVSYNRPSTSEMGDYDSYTYDLRRGWVKTNPMLAYWGPIGYKKKIKKKRNRIFAGF